MPIHFRENQYQGVNAHLHSYLQQHSEWSIFHADHISDLRRALQALLPPESGYFVVSEKSLQLLKDDLIDNRTEHIRTRPDIGVYRSSGSSPSSLSASQVVAPGAVVPMLDTIDRPEYVSSVAIYRVESDEAGLGTLVTRIEFLSPANKPPGSHYRQYLGRRDETLQTGINLVEIDYLHERQSPLSIIPSYPAREEKAYPYVITVSRPYPTFDEGMTAIYGFRVDDLIPTIAIPLEADDEIPLNLNAAYNETFASNYAYGLRLVDYAVLPEGFDTYDDEDQGRIRARMAAAVDVHSPD